MPRAAVFDIGATLVTGPPVAPNKVIAALMDGVTAAEVASVIMTTDLRSAGEVCQALERKFGPLGRTCTAGVEELWSAQSAAPTALEGAAEVVRELKSRGLRIGLLSDIWNPYFAGVEAALPEVVRTADSVVLSCRTGARKPHPDNFLTALQELAVEPAEAVMIGDTYEHDILPALELGMQAVWVLCRPDREHEWLVRVLNRDLPVPTATVASIGEVPDLPLFASVNCQL